MCVGDRIGEGLGRTLGFGASLAGAVAEALDACVGLGDRSCEGESLSGSIGSALELGAALTGTVAEALDRLRIRAGACDRLDGGDGEEGGVDDGEDLHVGR